MDIRLFRLAASGILMLASGACTTAHEFSDMGYCMDNPRPVKSALTHLDATIKVSDIREPPPAKPADPYWFTVEVAMQTPRALSSSSHPDLVVFPFTAVQVYDDEAGKELSVDLRSLSASKGYGSPVPVKPGTTLDYTKYDRYYAEYTLVGPLGARFHVHLPPMRVGDVSYPSEDIGYTGSDILPGCR